MHRIPTHLAAEPLRNVNDESILLLLCSYTSVNQNTVNSINANNTFTTPGITYTVNNVVCVHQEYARHIYGLTVAEQSIFALSRKWYDDIQNEETRVILTTRNIYFIPSLIQI